jgi:hypothetical protein
VENTESRQPSRPSCGHQSSPHAWPSESVTRHPSDSAYRTASSMCWSGCRCRIGQLSGWRSGASTHSSALPARPVAGNPRAGNRDAASSWGADHNIAAGRPVWSALAEPRPSIETDRPAGRGRRPVAIPGGRPRAASPRGGIGARGPSDRTGRPAIDPPPGREAATLDRAGRRNG